MAIVKIKSGTETFSAAKAGTSYQMAAGEAISTGNFGIEAAGGAKGREIEIDGDVSATLAAMKLGANGGSAGAVDLTIGKEGSLSSNNTGLLAYAGDHLIRNAGEISGGTSGILVYGQQTIVSGGLISGGIGVDCVGVDGHGVILRNAGTIQGTSTAFRGGEFGDRIVNSGHLLGDVLLGAGDDSFAMTAVGDIVGKVRGGFGNDSYTLGRTGVQVMEENGQGWDTVRSSVDHGLANNLEVLRLIGKGDLTGSGNGDDNQLFGNAGDNVLYGGFGKDVINGGRGDDILTGAFDADAFHFTRGTGTDAVFDFEPGIDEIHIHGLRGAVDFADMMARHVTEVDGDIWITYGKDVIVLSDTSRAELQGSDFVFI